MVENASNSESPLIIASFSDADRASPYLARMKHAGCKILPAALENNNPWQRLDLESASPNPRVLLAVHQTQHGSATRNDQGVAFSSFYYLNSELSRMRKPKKPDAILMVVDQSNMSRYMHEEWRAAKELQGQSDKDLAQFPEIVAAQLPDDPVAASTRMESLRTGLERGMREIAGQKREELGRRKELLEEWMIRDSSVSLVLQKIRHMRHDNDEFAGIPIIVGLACPGNAQLFLDAGADAVVDVSQQQNIDSLIGKLMESLPHAGRTGAASAPVQRDSPGKNQR
jgi:hypothetical protein